MARIYVTEQYTEADTYAPDWDGPQRAGFFTRESAKVWEGKTNWDGNNNADVNVGANRGQDLYRTAQGRWVLSTWSRWQGKDTTYMYVDETTARDWLLFNDHDKAAEEYFGEIEEERGPGRPEIGGRVNVRLGDLAQQVEQWAKEHGVKQAEAIRLLIAQGLAG